jgi:hypothetical protein
MSGFVMDVVFNYGFNILGVEMTTYFTPMLPLLGMTEVCPQILVSALATNIIEKNRYWFWMSLHGKI